LRNLRFWPHRLNHPRGLAFVVDDGDRIVEITRDYIKVRKGDLCGSIQRFWKSQ
jgi:hypothetical protein